MDTGLNKDKSREGQHTLQVGLCSFLVQIPVLACVCVSGKVFNLSGPRWYTFKPEIIAALYGISGGPKCRAQSSGGSWDLTVNLVSVGGLQFLALIH